MKRIYIISCVVQTKNKTSKANKQFLRIRELNKNFFLFANGVYQGGLTLILCSGDKIILLDKMIEKKYIFYKFDGR